MWLMVAASVSLTFSMWTPQITAGTREARGLRATAARKSRGVVPTAMCDCVRAELIRSDVCVATASVLSRTSLTTAAVTRAVVQACLSACHSFVDECFKRVEMHDYHHHNHRSCTDRFNRPARHRLTLGRRAGGR